MSIPSDYDQLIAQGQACVEAGDMMAARKIFVTALAQAPTLPAILGFVRAAWTTSPDKCLKLLKGAQASDVNSKLLIAMNRLLYQELHERTMRGLMPYHSHDIDDVLFRFSPNELSAYRSAAAAAKLDDHMALADFCYGEVNSIENLSLRKYQAGDSSIWSTIRLSPQHFEIHPSDDPSAGLPNLITERVAPGDGPVIWLACSGDYLPFVRPMLASLRNVGPEVAAHLHVMDPGPALDIDPALGLSWEQVGGDRNYYHAARFVRLWQWMDRYRRPAWLMDVDALFRNTPAPLFTRLTEADVAFRARPARLEPWNQYNASVVGFSTSTAAMDYLKRIAMFIARFRRLERLAWGIDQTAMLGAFRICRPRVRCLDHRDVDYDYRDDSIVWCNSSARKFRHLRNESDPERQIYIDLFRHYSPAAT